MKMTQKDYQVIVKALVIRHNDTSYIWEREDIINTLMKLLPKVRKNTLYVGLGEKLVANYLAEVDSNRADVLASLAQNPEVVHSTIAD